MANEPLYHVVQHLRRIVEGRGAGGLTDALLLERFVADGDQAAFEVLVWRHGPMVLGVCRRIVRQEQNAEDAFQATFLALARKAGSLRGRESLPGWLYRVASRIALRVRADTAKRARREQPTKEPPETLVTEEPADVIARREVRAVLDEELLRLPRKYRRPLILCDLQGKSHVQAARELGQAPGSMSRYLARGREMLRHRLTRRGVTLSAGVLAAALAEAAAAPAEMLVRPTVTAAVLFARGGAATGVVRGAAVVLAKAALRTMIVNKLRAVTVILLMGLACGGAGLLVHQRLAAKQLASPQREQGQSLLALRAGEQPKAADEAKPHVDRQGDPLPPGAFLRLGSVRLRHGAPVRRVVFSPDGKTLASASLNDAARIWDAQTGAEIHRLGDPQDSPLVVAFSPDGETLVSADIRGVFRSWSMATGAEVRRRRNPLGLGSVGVFAFAPDGRTVACGDLLGSVRLLATTTGKELRQWVAIPKKPLPPGAASTGLENAVRSLAFSPDGKVLVVSGDGATIGFWEAATGKKLRQLARQTPVSAVAFSPDSKTLAVVDRDSVCLLDAATGRELHRLAGPWGDIRSLVFSADGKTLAAAGDGRIIGLWETAAGKLLHRLQGHFGPIYSLAFSPDGRTLASGGYDNTIRLWDVVRGKEQLPSRGHQAPIGTVAFGPDGKTLATASFDRTVRLWDTTTGAERRQLRGHTDNVTGVCFSPDGTRIVTASRDGTIRLWDTASGKERQQLGGPERQVSCLAMSRDGRLLASGGEYGLLRLWDVEEGRELWRLIRGKIRGDILRVAFSPDGKTLAAASADETIRLWDAVTGNEIRRLANKHGWQSCMFFSPDGEILASDHSDGSIRLWNAGTGELVRELKGNRFLVSALAFAPDGKTLASSSYGYGATLHLWEVATGHERYRSPEYRGPVWALAYSADGRLLASASSDSTTLLWDMTGRDFVAAPPKELSPQQLTALWKDLTGEDAVLAYRAACTFYRVPKQAVPFLQKQTRQEENPHRERIAKLVRDLDDDAFKVRERASRELAEMGDLAAPALRNALEKQPSAELRQRVALLLGALKSRTPSAEQRQALRVTEVLERLATPEARRLLETFAKGAPESPLTAEAKASLERLSQSSQALQGS